MPESGSPAVGVGRGPPIRGEVVYLYAFDVANEIRLDRAAELLSAKTVPLAVRPERAARESLPAARPLEVEPAPPAAGLAGRLVRALVHVYDVGIVCVVGRARFEVGALPDLAPLHRPSLDDGRSAPSPGPCARTPADGWRPPSSSRGRSPTRKSTRPSA